MRLKDLTGMVFGRLTVQHREGTKNKKVTWLCRCSCGSSLAVVSQNLLDKHTRSCGCLQRELVSKRTSTHRKSQSKIYDVWCKLVSRCQNEKDKSYASYGGRGITVCDEWLDFSNFYNDMGDAPKNKSIDRINNDAGYSKENCRWATKHQQTDNRRVTLWLTHNGETRSLRGWADKLNLNYARIFHRYKKGWDSYRILFEPKYKGRELDAI